MIAARLNPDWYRVKYNLAALHATWSSSIKDKHEPLTEAQRHRTEARILSRDVAVSALEQFLERTDETDPPLKSLLETSILPSALLIYAGTGDPEKVKDTERSEKPNDEDVKKEQRELLAKLKEGGLDERAATEFAIRHTRPTARFLYNLACLYSQAGDPQDAVQRRAAKELMAALEAGPEAERKELAKSASEDPSLAPLRHRLAEQELEQSLSKENLVTAVGILKLFVDP